MLGLTILTGRMDKSIFTQQRSLQDAKEVIELINREIRLATAPLRVVDTDGNPAAQSNCVEFARIGEAAGARSLELVADDGDMLTPGDNQLVFDPDTTTGGDEIAVVRMISPTDLNGVFSYTGATAPLVVRMRTGDPVGVADMTAINARTGSGMQGVEINIRVAPRN